jgi:hypothetical protein
MKSNEHLKLNIIKRKSNTEYLKNESLNKNNSEKVIINDKKKYKTKSIDDISQIQKQNNDSLNNGGYLNKKGGKLRTIWQKRYFEINENEKLIKYYKNDNIKGVINFIDIKELKENEKIDLFFQIILPEKTVFLEAFDIESKFFWVDNINKIILNNKNNEDKKKEYNLNEHKKAIITKPHYDYGDYGNVNIDDFVIILKKIDNCKKIFNILDNTQVLFKNIIHILPNDCFKVLNEKELQEFIIKSTFSIILNCINRIEKDINEEGIYRISASSKVIKELSYSFNIGNEPDLTNYDVHTSCSLISFYLLELTTSLFDYDNLLKPLLNCQLLVNLEDTLNSMKEIILKYPLDYQIFLKNFFSHLKKVTDNSLSNKMGTKNLSIIFAPLLFKIFDLKYNNNQYLCIERFINNIEFFFSYLKDKSIE